MKQSHSVLFLFNHDAAHQAAHIAGIMREMALSDDDFRIVAATGTPTIAATVRDLVGESAAGRIDWKDLSLSPGLSALLAIPNKIAPVRRIARLYQALMLIREMDAVISTERTCLRIRRRLRKDMGDAAPYFIYVPHGSGDRNVAYHPELRQYDYHLLSGRKLVDEMVGHDIAREDQCRVIGYAKFDAVSGQGQRRIFQNDLPTIVYNPHFDPKISSWYDHGPQLLTALASMSDRFNVVFAPHVMLFRKKLHISPEYRMARFRPEIPDVARAAPNILLDVDGPRLFDMSYTLSSDIYVGDVSSQVYEFLRFPRPVFFMDAARQGDDAYPFWRNGPVHTSIVSLLRDLVRYQSIGENYRTIQQTLFSYTIDVDPLHTASQRGGKAITDIVGRRSRRAD